MQSIVLPDLGELHIAICDNASTDDTAAIVEKYKSKFPNFDYRRNRENLGPDRNYMAAADMARGDYCLLMGSDDAFMPESIGKIVGFLDEDPDLFVYNRIDASYDMKPIRRMHAADFSSEPTKLNIRSEQDMVSYFDHCNSIGAVYSYLSSVVFRVDRWKREKCPDILLGSAYPHTGIFLMIMLAGCTLVYSDEPLVMWRGGNDSFLSGDMSKRVHLDLDGYDLLAKTVLPAYPKAASALRRLVVREHTDWYMKRFEIFLPRKLRMSEEGWDSVNRRLYELGTPGGRYRFYDMVTPIWLLPSFVRRFLLTCYLQAKRLVT